MDQSSEDLPVIDRSIEEVTIENEPSENESEEESHLVIIEPIRNSIDSNASGKPSIRNSIDSHASGKSSAERAAKEDTFLRIKTDPLERSCPDCFELFDTHLKLVTHYFYQHYQEDSKFEEYEKKYAKFLEESSQGLFGSMEIEDRDPIIIKQDPEPNDNEMGPVPFTAVNGRPIIHVDPPGLSIKKSDNAVAEKDLSKYEILKRIQSDVNIRHCPECFLEFNNHFRVTTHYFSKHISNIVLFDKEKAKYADRGQEYMNNLRTALTSRTASLDQEENASLSTKNNHNNNNNFIQPQGINGMPWVFPETSNGAPTSPAPMPLFPWLQNPQAWAAFSAMNLFAVGQPVEPANSRKRKSTDSNEGSRRNYPCEMCDLTFKFHTSLIRHMKAVHSTKRKFECDKCSFAADTFTHFRLHYASEHKIEDTYIYCDKCDAKFKDLSSLKRHVTNKHEGNKKPFQCDRCTLCFTERSNLKKHIDVVHEGIRPYACHLCDYRGTRRDRLKNHMETVHDNRAQKIVCDFIECQGIKRNWAGAKEDGHKHKFSCQRCTYSSTRRFNLERHVETHHKNDVIVARSKYKGAVDMLLDAVAAYSVDNNEAYNSLVDEKGGSSDETKDDPSWDDLFEEETSEEANELPGLQDDPLKNKECPTISSTIDKLPQVKTETASVVPKLLKCELCDFTCLMMTSLASHIAAEHEDHTLSCKHCDYTSFDIFDLEKHKFTDHPFEMQEADNSPDAKSLDPDVKEAEPSPKRRKSNEDSPSSMTQDVPTASGLQVNKKSNPFSLRIALSGKSENDNSVYSGHKNGLEPYPFGRYGEEVWYTDDDSNSNEDSSVNEDQSPALASRVKSPIMEEKEISSRTGSPIMEKNEFFKCYLCAFSCSTNAELNNHVMGVHHDKFVANIIQNLRNNDVKNGQLNIPSMPSNESKPTFQCAQCDFSCSVMGILLAHIAQCHKSRSALTAPHKLYKTFETKRDETAAYNCQQCSFTAPVMGILLQHIATEHQIKKSYECHQCPFKCSSLAEFEDHVVRTHKKRNQPYSCRLCDYVSNLAVDLDRHMATNHQGKRIYNCEFCYYSSRRRFNLDRHIMTHHPDGQIVDTPRMRKGRKLAQFQSRAQTETKDHQMDSSEVKVEPVSNDATFSESSEEATALGTSNANEASKEVPITVFETLGEPIISEAAKDATDSKAAKDATDSNEDRIERGSELQIAEYLERVEARNYEIYNCTICEFKCAQKCSLKRHMRSVHDRSRSGVFPGATVPAAGAAVSVPAETVPVSVATVPVQVSVPEATVSEASQDTTVSNVSDEVISKEAVKLRSPSEILKNVEARTVDIYNCKVCDFKCAQKSSLKRHMLTVHDGSRPFPCPRCPMSFAELSNMKKHISVIHDGIRPYVCQYCGYKGTRRDRLRNHIARCHESMYHTNKSIIGPHYKCDDCEFSTNELVALHNHMTAAHNYFKQPSCDKCEFKSNNVDEMRAHKIISHAPKVPSTEHRCFICDLSLPTKQELILHVGQAHRSGLPNLRQYDCSKCNFKCVVKKQLLQHLKEEHFEEKEFACERCGVTFSKIGDLEDHTSFVHDGDSPFCCSICEFASTTWHSLDNHMTEVHGHEQGVTPVVAFLNDAKTITIQSDEDADDKSLNNHVAMETNDVSIENTNNEKRSMVTNVNKAVSLVTDDNGNDVIDVNKNLSAVTKDIELTINADDMLLP